MVRTRGNTGADNRPTTHCSGRGGIAVCGTPPGFPPPLNAGALGVWLLCLNSLSGVFERFAMSLRRQVSLFITDSLGESIQALRQRWDPVMAARIPAHVTVVYDAEAADAVWLFARLHEVSHAVMPFRLHIGRTAMWQTPSAGIYVTVADTDGGFARLRTFLVAPSARTQPCVTLHLTLMHPRTNGAHGPVAWNAVQHMQFDQDTLIDRVMVIENTGDHWYGVAEIRLGSHDEVVNKKGAKR